jgi:hypothetical protein
MLWLMKEIKIEANCSSPADRTESCELSGMYWCTTPLEAAIIFEQEETALALLALEGQELNLNSRDRDGQTVLYLAASYNLVKLAEVLVRLGHTIAKVLPYTVVPSSGFGFRGSAGLLFQGSPFARKA